LIHESARWFILMVMFIREQFFLCFPLSRLGIGKASVTTYKSWLCLWTRSCTIPVNKWQ
jgi:hypothetical protein